MQINVRGKNLEVTPALREYVEKKLNRINKHFDEALAAHVNLCVERNLHKVEVTVTVGTLILRGQESTDDMYGSIDLVVDKLERQVRKFKTRVYRKQRRLAATGTEEGAVLLAEPELAEQEGVVVKSKRFAVKPMTTEDAIIQMELLGHDFFVFRSAETDGVCVLYRRKDGNYGLLEPEY
jgi:putative sigma-54 modulation protein